MRKLASHIIDELIYEGYIEEKSASWAIKAIEFLDDLLTDYNREEQRHEIQQ